MLTRLAPTNGAGDQTEAAKGDARTAQPGTSEQEKVQDFATVLREAEAQDAPPLAPILPEDNSVPAAQKPKDAAQTDTAAPPARDTSERTRPLAAPAIVPASKQQTVDVSAPPPQRPSDHPQPISAPTLPKTAAPAAHEALASTKAPITPNTEDLTAAKQGASAEQKTPDGAKLKSQPSSTAQMAFDSKTAAPLSSAKAKTVLSSGQPTQAIEGETGTTAPDRAVPKQTADHTGTPRSVIEGDAQTPLALKTPSRPADPFKQTVPQTPTSAKLEAPQNALPTGEVNTRPPVNPQSDRLQTLQIVPVPTHAERRADARTTREPAAPLTAPVSTPIKIAPKPTPVFATIPDVAKPVSGQSSLSPLSSFAEAEPLMLSRFDASGGTPVQTTPTAPLRMDLAQHVSRQVAEALQNMPARPVEISLNPDELGRVRLGVSSSEAGIIVSVLAERPETIDLMRRHINNLEAAFQAIGYSDISFSFAGGDAQDTGEGDQTKTTTPDSGVDDATPTAEAPQTIHLQTNAAAGLDLRL